MTNPFVPGDRVTIKHGVNSSLCGEIRSLGTGRFAHLAWVKLDKRDKPRFFRRSDLKRVKQK